MPNNNSSLYRFINSSGEFEASKPERKGPIYFPLANESGMLSAITPDLKGDIKLDQHAFLTHPMSLEDLHLSRASRGFWIRLSDGRSWCVTQGESTVRAGFLWHSVIRKSSKLGLEAEILNFVPWAEHTIELMSVTVRNTSRKSVSMTGISAIPLFGRSADNLRDHRHVTSLLNRISKTKYGLTLCPTMSFNERGHQINRTSYFVSGFDGKGKPPIGLFPTIESFIGAGGSLDHPRAVLEKWPAHKKIIPMDQGKEVMGALQFSPVALKPGASVTFALVLGIKTDTSLNDKVVDKVTEEIRKKSMASIFEETKRMWNSHLDRIQFKTGDDRFNAWIRWVQLQPTLRKIFGCSFLPDFDYGKGGRGWRDLWQDCLALLLSSPDEVRHIIVKNFGGIRIDGSNATIISRKGTDVEFVADRNNITRTWMDHGVWPFLTTKLYLDQSGDWDLLLEKASYFRDGQMRRASKLDPNVEPGQCVLRTTKGSVYSGSLLEHILVQHLVQFFNVGEHNIIKLEDADWNDGLDMAHHRGESVAFTHLYAGNLEAIAQILLNAKDKLKWRFVSVAKELLLLLDQLGSPINYDSVDFKRKRLDDYYSSIEHGVSGDVVDVPIDKLMEDLASKAKWMREHLNRQEWVSFGGKQWMNGYYDNQGNRVEGVDAQRVVKMTLTGQVYPILAKTVNDEKVPQIIDAVNTYLWDKSLKGIRLNTNFHDLQPNLGRAFSFAFGEKENGAVFSHMVVMYANALYSRGFVKDGFIALNSLYQLATNSEKSRIFPGLPEYFNNEAQGRYNYLTGSASWMILTLLTQVFGVRGFEGDLIISPKLDPSQFDRQGRAEVLFHFADAKIRVQFVNAKKTSFDRLSIGEVKAQQGDLSFERISSREIRIPRYVLRTRNDWVLSVELKEI